MTEMSSFSDDNAFKKNKKIRWEENKKLITLVSQNHSFGKKECTKIQKKGMRD